MKIIKRLFCKHNYNLVDEYFESTPLEGPTSICINQCVLIYKCSKCGKECKIKY